MRKDTMFVGLLDKYTKTQQITTVDAYKVVANIFVKTTGGATITEGIGVYTHENGETVIEPSLVCMVYGADDDTITQAAEAIKVALNQESVIVETSESNSKFI